MPEKLPPLAPSQKGAKDAPEAGAAARQGGQAPAAAVKEAAAAAALSVQQQAMAERLRSIREQQQGSPAGPAAAAAQPLQAAREAPSTAGAFKLDAATVGWQVLLTVRHQSEGLMRQPPLAVGPPGPV